MKNHARKTCAKGVEKRWDKLRIGAGFPVQNAVDFLSETGG